MNNRLALVNEALAELRHGRMVILADDEDRENEGDMILPAEFVTPTLINFMIKNGGLVCLAMTEYDSKRLQLPLLPRRYASKEMTPNFMTSFGAAQGVHTGISAADRAATITRACDPASTAQDFVTPGHVFPLLANEGGVFGRQGHTEGSIDLLRLAGLRPMAVICEVMNADGTMAKGQQLREFAEQHKMPFLSVSDIQYYRMYHETLIREVAKAKLPVRGRGTFTIKTFQSVIDGSEHLALMKEPIEQNAPALVRIHSECLTGDLFDSARCDCGWQLDHALDRISEQGGVLIYLRQEGRGIGLVNKIRAYSLQDTGLDTVEANNKLGFSADHRDYGIAAQMLRYMGLTQVHLLTNNPRKIEGIAQYGINVVQREAVEMPPTEDNITYLKTKRDKLGHLLPIDMEISA
ncbi:MAG: GTP cyclohydrolase II [Pseudomonadota bacterium]|nr:GTP cyclohydrolase II [Pseudomonadota bacterium]